MMRLRTALLLSGSQIKNLYMYVVVSGFDRYQRCCARISIRLSIVPAASCTWLEMGQKSTAREKLSSPTWTTVSKMILGSPPYLTPIIAFC
ncbi:MAG: hypothetical protein ACLQF1_21035, partial [Methyloceanibacter sp.]